MEDDRKENHKKILEYLLGKENRTEIMQRMLNKLNGIQPELAAKCSGSTGCTPTTPYGDCEVIGGACEWIPEIG